MWNEILDYVAQRFIGEKVNFLIYIREGSSPVKLINSPSDKFSICFFIIPNSSFVRQRIEKRQIQFWWWQFECNDEWIQNSKTKFVWKVKIRPMQEDGLKYKLVPEYVDSNHNY